MKWVTQARTPFIRMIMSGSPIQILFHPLLLACMLLRMWTPIQDDRGMSVAFPVTCVDLIMAEDERMRPT